MKSISFLLKLVSKDIDFVILQYEVTVKNNVYHFYCLDWCWNLFNKYTT